MMSKLMRTMKLIKNCVLYQRQGLKGRARVNWQETKEFGEHILFYLCFEG
jgi:hypothetical protein